ncbi:alpha/beta hydrolase fold domain-containing protein [Streptomyces justiciae]|uniref:alpha/beta hydrolase fold domain-containing protein n=1 Tax=Streptomyces justiciae TaxID=2780140 RepID=UPI001881D0CE|nr:alpha/beta hydrolase fold domain-containing protein [Streptomyces justiciae]MBE8472216.1 alpha/beta hydrolase fold domain-containing protein [Streptomyces justiciae]
MTEQTAADIFGPVTARPPLDPELAPAEEVMRGFLPVLSDETLPEARRRVAEGMAGREPDLTAGGRVRVEERQVPGPDGAPELTVLILSPVEDRGAKGGILHIHGGGMILGDRRTGVSAMLPFVAEGSAVVVSVEYRLAPEHPDPAPVEDCYAGLVWLAKNAEELGVDPGRLLVVGTSAGGGLAAGTALLARDRAFPRLSHQVLICPMLDDRFRTHSSRMLDGEGTWDRNSNLYGWTALLGERRGGPDVSPYAAPARAEDLGGLPRTYIDTGSVEVFRDEILTYARRLSEAGVSVDLHMWGGGFHGFDGIAAQAAVSRASVATREEFIRRALEA